MTKRLRSDADIEGAAPNGVRGLRRLVLWPPWAKILTVLGALAAVAATVIAGMDRWDPRERVAGAALTIDTPQGAVPFCASFGGSAPPRNGKKVLVAIHYGDNDYFIREATSGDDRWSFRGEVGSINGGAFDFFLTVFQLDEPSSDFLTKAEARAHDDGAAYVLFPGPPPGAENLVTRKFTRDNDANPQHCGRG